jgi:hypothetical protein
MTLRDVTDDERYICEQRVCRKCNGKGCDHCNGEGVLIVFSYTPTLDDIAIGLAGAVFFGNDDR